ncbi:MAG TPA: thiamine-binding protein [Cyclobacteriaceae bacterium]|nr:thiamine-binding protein [Cyclobacteriaceae bacterium]
MSGNQINAAIQVLPRSKDRHPYAIVDEAIDEIRKSGLNYKVCPFETVVEGYYREVVDLIEKISSRCLKEGAEELLINVKLQIRKEGDVTMEEKIGKYS